MQEHPFAPYVRILGKGKTGTRSLTREEAREAMAMILRDEVEDVQLGAFLMLLRVKEESHDELTGFVQAVRDALPQDNIPLVDLDWASYAGKRRQLPWYLLSALLLAQNGVRVLMHGAAGHTAGRLYSEQVLHELGIKPAANWQQAGEQLDQDNFSFFPLRNFSPQLQRIIDLRNQFGLRSPVHTLARLINPGNATYSMQSIFHPAYAHSHQLAAQALGQQHAAVFKGEGGEVERRPEARCTVFALRDGVECEYQWPKMVEGRQTLVENPNAEDLARTWRGQRKDTYGAMAVTGTTAIALMLLQRADCEQQALEMARDMWERRDKQRF